MSEKITIHHLEASRSLKVLWLAEFLQVPYELKTYSRDPQSRYAQDRDALVAVHPLGRSPTMTVDLVNGERLTIAEGGAIMTYLLEHHGRTGEPKPSEKSQRAQDINFWIHFGESSVMLHTIPFMYGLRGGVTSSDGSGVFDKASARGLKIDLDYLEEELSKRQGTLAGNGQIGAADIAVQVSVQLLQGPLKRASADYWKNLNIELGPHTQTWLQKSLQEPSYQAAVDREIAAGGKVQSREQWLDPLIKS